MSYRPYVSIFSLCCFIFYRSESIGAQLFIDLGKSPSASPTLDVQTNSNDEIDSNYKKFMMETYGWTKATLTKIQQIVNPFYLDAYYSTIGTLKHSPKYLPGKHTHPQAPYLTNYWYGRLDTNFDDIHPLNQGWKIHVSAQPWSAQKIASIVLPFLHHNAGKKGKIISYKVIPSIPLMRSLWDFSNLEGRESQVGKFIVIYADDADHAYFLAKEVDQLLLDAKASGFLQEFDFYPLIGDAMIGHSKGVFARYGGYSDKPFIKVKPNYSDPLDTIKQDITQSEEDNRFYPWPDFMNKNNEEWQREPSPFHDLPISWTNYYTKQTIASWQDRPFSWQTSGDTSAIVSDYVPLTVEAEEPIMYHPSPLRTLKAFSFEQEGGHIGAAHRDDEFQASQDLYSGSSLSPSGSSNY